MSSPTPDPELRDLLAEAEQFQKDSPVLGRIHTYLPFGILLGVGVLLFVAGRLGTIAAAGVTSFFTIGKMIILVGAIPDQNVGMTTYELALMILFMDCWVAYFLAYNLHHVYRVPKAGPWLERVQNYCRYWLDRQAWMRRWVFTGVMLFVMFPLTGTGAPGGCILGRLGGMRPSATLIAIALGSVLGCGLLVAFAEELRPVFDELRHEWWFTGIGIAILVIVIVALVFLGRKLSRAAEDYARTSGDQS